MSVTLALDEEPSVERVLALVLEKGEPWTTYELIHYDRFTRIFCACGRHTYGSLEVDALTEETFTVPFRCKTKPESYWYDLYMRGLVRAQATYDRHSQQGRCASVCDACTCVCMSDVKDPRLAHAGHHQVLDLGRPCLDRVIPDQYSVPDKPTWQGAPYSTRKIEIVHRRTSQYLIQRSDGLWVYVDTYDCSATPDYKCSNSHTSVYWSDDFAVVWNRYMTHTIRMEFWKKLNKQ